MNSVEILVVSPQTALVENDLHTFSRRDFTGSKEGCCSTTRENKRCTDIFKKSVYDVDLWKDRRTRRTVLLLLLYKTVSDENVLILKCTIYRDVFHS